MAMPKAAMRVRNGEKSERRGNVHLRGEESHGSRKAVAAEPAQEFLRAVREKDDAQHQAREGERGVVDRGQQLLEHGTSVPRLERLVWSTG